MYSYAFICVLCIVYAVTSASPYESSYAAPSYYSDYWETYLASQFFVTWTEDVDKVSLLIYVQLILNKCRYIYM